MQCLLGQHLDTSLLVQNVTTEQIAQLVAAASACGVTIPPALLNEIATNLITLRSDPRITCLGSQGLTLPAPGAAPTLTEIASYRAALQTCGLVSADARPASPAPRAAAKAKVEQKKAQKKAVRKSAKKRAVRPSARRH